MSLDAWTLSTQEFRLLWEEIDASDYPVEFAFTGEGDLAQGADAAHLRPISLGDLTVRHCRRCPVRRSRSGPPGSTRVGRSPTAAITLASIHRWALVGDVGSG